MQSILDEPGADDVWRQLAPHLEAAMSRLGERDRTLLALRYYENKTGAEAAALLGIREEAARKRTNRALEKLRRFFFKRGVTSTTAAIAGAISSNSVQIVPMALAKSVTAVALVKGAAASASTLTLIKGALKLMAWTKAKTAIMIGVSVLLAAGTTTVMIHHQLKQLPKPQPIASSQAEYPRATWRFSGYANPESAFESTFWAMSQGDAKTYLATLASDGGLFKEAQGKSENEIVAENRRTVEGLTGYRIIDTKIVSADRVILTILPETGTGQGPKRPGRLVILRIEGEWKVSG